ncbi:hypothetical protein BN871_EW_00110 [Paenibacillus sp. P22]|nr:hypothetical protein BN871_EW_00110 [Paenibacillus sp. P22]
MDLSAARLPVPLALQHMRRSLRLRLLVSYQCTMRRQGNEGSGESSLRQG